MQWNEMSLCKSSIWLNIDSSYHIGCNETDVCCIIYYLREVVPVSGNAQDSK